MFNKTFDILWNIRSRLNSSKFWVFELTFEFTLNRTEINQNFQCAQGQSVKQFIFKSYAKKNFRSCDRESTLNTSKIIVFVYIASQLKILSQQQNFQFCVPQWYKILSKVAFICICFSMKYFYDTTKIWETSSENSNAWYRNKSTTSIIISLNCVHGCRK